MIRIVLTVLAAISIASPVRAASAVKISFKLVEAAFKTSECTSELKDEERSNVENLSGGLKLVEIYCWSAAYQAGSIFFAVNPAAADKSRLLRFQWWSGKRLVWVHSMSNPGYNPKTRTLSSFHKGRGVGDCGSNGEWKWINGNFKLTRFWHKDACDGIAFDSGKRWQVFPPRR